MVLGCLCLVGTNGFSLAIPWLLKQAIDALRTLSPTVAHGIVVRDAILIIVFAVLQALIRTWSRIFIFDAARNIEYGVRRDLFAHLTRLDPAFYRRHPTGDVMSRLTNDLTAVRALYGPGLLNFAQHRAGVRHVADAAAAAVAAPDAAGAAPLPAAAAGRAAREPEDSPRQPRHPGPAGRHVDDDPGGSGRHRGGQALHARGVAAARVPRRQRRVPGSRADAGTRPRAADAAVRDAG